MDNYWCVVPAAGAGRRFGAVKPKQYHDLAGRPLIVRTLERLASHPRIAGLMVVIAADDPWWPGIERIENVTVATTIGGAERADSVLAGLRALPASVAASDWVMVHDAARPCLRHEDLSRLLEQGTTHPVGAILATRVRDTVKQEENQEIARTVPREHLWRALTPQLFRRGELIEALARTRLENGRKAPAPTDDANALELMGKKPLLVEGYDDNLKITSSIDLALAEWILQRQAQR
jgi:2-C-methyl-D-erythritol 4-phosphate cytidylyltransferase